MIGTLDQRTGLRQSNCFLLDAVDLVLDSCSAMTFQESKMCTSGKGGPERGKTIANTGAGMVGHKRGCRSLWVLALRTSVQLSRLRAAARATSDDGTCEDN